MSATDLHPARFEGERWGCEEPENPDIHAQDGTEWSYDGRCPACRLAAEARYLHAIRRFDAMFDPEAPARPVSELLDLGREIGAAMREAERAIGDGSKSQPDSTDPQTIGPDSAG